MDKKSSPPKVYGLIGYPVEHSLSPLMHNAAFRTLKIPAEYKLFPLKPEEIEVFLKNTTKENICGLNVTVPYKEKVISFLDNVSSEAELIGAVNTIKVSSDKLEGFNTDGQGFLRHLKEDLKFNPQGKAIALIGAGGAARAISVSLSKANSKTLAIYDIDRQRAKGLIEHLKNHFQQVEFVLADSLAKLNIEKSDLLINATPIGMKVTDPCLVEEGVIPKGLLVYDLIYNPCLTQLLERAKNSGAKISNGLGMLLYQGALSFEIWTGEVAPLEIMRAALEEATK